MDFETETYEGLAECCFFLHVRNPKSTPGFAKYVQEQLKTDRYV